MEKPLLRVNNLSKWYKADGQIVQAVANVSLDIYKGEIVGIAGESGCGKTTFGKMLVRLIEPTSGSISFKNQDLCALSGKALIALRQKIQIVLQDPYGSLNPRQTVENIIGEGLDIHGIARGNLILQALESVGLSSDFLGRFPNQLSGGQRQRVNLARALVLRPDFLVLDESVSALDSAHKRQILAILKKFQQQFQLTCLFISHDLSVLKSLCSRIGVMYKGSLVEIGPADLVSSFPRHPYTEALISAIPMKDPIKEKNRRLLPLIEERKIEEGFCGCVFYSRCPKALDHCKIESPPLLNGLACLNPSFKDPIRD